MDIALQRLFAEIGQRAEKMNRKQWRMVGCPVGIHCKLDWLPFPVSQSQMKEGLAWDPRPKMSCHPGGDEDLGRVVQPKLQLLTWRIIPVSK